MKGAGYWYGTRPRQFREVGVSRDVPQGLPKNPSFWYGDLRCQNGEGGSSAGRR